MPREEQVLIFKRSENFFCVFNYLCYSVLLIVVTIMSMGVVSYFVVRRSPKPIRLSFSFTDDSHPDASSKFPSTTVEEVLRQRHQDECGSKICNHEAERILLALNSTANPCDDFYVHACSIWMDKHQPSDMEEKMSADYDLLDRYTRFLASVLSGHNDQAPSVKLIFDNCVHPPTNLFNEVRNSFFYTVGFQNWPYSVSHRLTAADLSSKVGALYQLMGLDSLFHFSIVEDPEDRHPSMSLEEPELLSGHWGGSLAELGFLDEAFRGLMGYLRRTVDTSVALLEADLAGRKAHRQNLECTELLKHCATVHINHLPPSRVVHWPNMAESAFGEKFVALNPFVRASNIDYLLSFGSSNQQTLNKADLLNYLAFRLCMGLSPLISNTTLRRQLASITYGRNPLARQPLPSPYYCVRFFNRFEPYLPMYLAYDRSVKRLNLLVLQDTVLGHLNLTLFNYVQREFKDWFSGDFTTQVLQKLRKVNWEPLAPQSLLQKSFKKKYISGLYTGDPTIPLSSYFYFWIRRAAKRRRSTIDAFEEDLRTGWKSGFLSTWANLEAPFNVLEIPLPVFNFGMANDPHLLKFHIPRAAYRIYHSFFKYIYYLSYGFYFNTTTSDPASIFENLRGCLQTDYAQLSPSFTSKKVDSEKTSISDMVDLMAVRLAFRAYRLYLRRSDSHFRFAKAPHLTSEQLFFIYYALSHCENHNPHFLEHVLRYSASSPGWYRVNGPLRHMREFATAFQCAPGTFMNPQRKCGFYVD